MNSFISYLNAAGGGFVEFAVPMLIQSGLLIVVLLGLNGLLRRRVRAVVRYWLWMLVLIKLILPVHLAIPTGLAYWLPDAWLPDKLTPVVTPAPISPISVSTSQPLSISTTAMDSTPETFIPLPTTEEIAPSNPTPGEKTAAPAPRESVENMAAAPSSITVPAVNWQAVVFIVWLVAAGAMVLLLIQRLFFVRGLIAQSRLAEGPLRETLDECRQQMAVRRNVELRLSPNATSPSVCGLLRPVILLPQDLPERLQPPRLRAIFLHELAHIKRGDLWVSLVQTLLQIAYFYHPLLWLANAMIRRLREQAVDEMVLVALGDQAGEYPETLIDVSRLSLTRPALSLRLIGVVESKSTLAARIKHILSRPYPKSARLGLAGLLTILVTAAVLLPMAKATSKGGSTENILVKIQPEKQKNEATLEGSLLEGFIPRGVLSGRVSDEQGRPIEGVQIEIQGTSWGQTFTDAHGIYYFDTVERYGNHRITVNAPHHVGIRNWDKQPVVNLKETTQTVKHFVLPPGCQINVQVVDESGRPVEKTMFLVTSLLDDQFQELTERTYTDEIGMVTIGGIPPSETNYLLTAIHDDFAPAKLLVKLNDPGKIIADVIALKEGIQIQGRAICSDGEPASGWKIYSQPSWWYSAISPKNCIHSIDEQGNFTMHHVIPGDYKISIGIPHDDKLGSTTVFLVTQATLPPATGLLEVKIPKPSPRSLVSIRGTITYKGEDLPKGQTVRIEADSPNKDEGSSMVKLGDKEFEINNVPPGIYTLIFESQSIKHKIIEGVEAPGEGLLVELEVVGKPLLKGSVIDAATGQPVTDFKVRARKLRTLSGANYTQSDRWQKIENPAGEFQMAVVGPGIYQVQVAAKDFAWLWSEEINTDTDSDMKIILELSRGTTITGRVVNEAGKPVSGAKVIPLSKASGSVLNIFTSEEGAVETTDDGSFTLDNLTPGREALKVRHPDYCFTIRRNITLKEGGSPANLEITLREGGTVQGYIYDADGKPQPNVTMRVQDNYSYSGTDQEEAGRFATVTTDTDGFYRAEHLPMQLCYIRRAEEWGPLGIVRQAIFPENGKVSTLNFGGSGRITGQLVVNGKPLENNRLLITGDNPYFGIFKSYAQTTKDGSFTFLGTPVGQRKLYYLMPETGSGWVRVKTLAVDREDIRLGTIDFVVGKITVTVEGDLADRYWEGLRVMLEEYNPMIYADQAAGKLLPHPNTKDPYQFVNVPPGTYHISALSPGYPSYRKTIDLDSTQQNVEITLTIPRGTASLHGTFHKNLFSGGRGIPIRLIRSDEQILTRIFADENGDYHIMNLPAGDYTIHYSYQRNWKPLISVSLADGEDKVLHLDQMTCTLPAEGMLHAIVISQEGIPLPDAKVYLRGPLGQLGPYAAYNQSYFFSGQAGNYVLSAEYPGYSPVSQNVELSLKSPENPQDPPATIKIRLPIKSKL